MRGYLYILIALCCIFTGCRDYIEDQEIKGILTVDPSAFGNKFLEFNDKESNLTRFIHPGAKIVQLNRTGFSGIEIKLMDARRAQLGHIIVDKDAYKGDENNFKISNRDLHQDWDIAGTTTPVLLKKETYPTRHSKSCKVKGCTGNSCDGWIGKVWYVTEVRNDFDINFMVPDTDKVWGHFEAKGSLKINGIVVNTDECRPQQVIVNVDEEKFE